MDIMSSEKELKGHAKDGKSNGAPSGSDTTLDDEVKESSTSTLGMTGSRARVPTRSLGESDGVAPIQVPPSSAAIRSASADGKPESTDGTPAPAQKAHQDGVTAVATTKGKLPGSITVDSASFKWNDRSLMDEHALDFSQGMGAISKKGKGSRDRTRKSFPRLKGNGRPKVDDSLTADSNTASAETRGSEGNREPYRSTDAGRIDDDRDREGSGRTTGRGSVHDIVRVGLWVC